MASRLFGRRLWQRVNDRFRDGEHFYVEAPRPWRYRRKAALMFRWFPKDEPVLVQAAYLAKNLVNLQRFPDANKRTTSILLEVFLESNGYVLDCDDEAYVAFLLDVQRRVPPNWWDGRSFTLRKERIRWSEHPYHSMILDWIRSHAISKETNNGASDFVTGLDADKTVSPTRGNDRPQPIG